MTNGPAVRVLGPVRLRTADGGWAEPPGSLPTRLVVALALAGQDGRSVAALAEDVWPDREPRNPRAALQMLVSRTRAVAEDGAVESTAAGYRLGASDLGLAERADGAGAAAALALWRGEPAADLEPSSVADELAARAARARRRLLTLEGDRLQREQRPAEALPLLEELVAADPLDGAATRSLMLALRDSGAADRALAAFARHREALADALGTDPAAETTALNTELLRRAADGDDRGGAELVGVRASATPLLGRDEDVGRLLAAVSAHRLVSIVGTGGLGKTRLAHAVAGGVAGRFDRIVFTELAGAREADDVALVVGATVGARPAQAPRRIGDPPPADLASRTREALAASRTLLVLDNCEQVVDAVARLTADLLAAVPGLTVLTTSRIPLLLAGEQVVAVQPLPPAGAAAALFTVRASSARPGVALDPHVIERVCQRLDGLPLAIELAAARLRSMSLAELDRRLEDRFAVLVGGDRTAPERHRTLFAVIDWSRRLLSPAARDALALLAVFPDGFTAASAADLLDADATDVLLELVDQSLLAFRDDRGADGRYRMLETVREFGLRDLADTDRLPEARRALDRWALRLVRRLDAGLLLGRSTAASRAIADEEETLLGVLRAAPAGREQVVTAVFGVLAEHWAYRGDFEAAIDALPHVIAAAGRRPIWPEERAESLRALSLAAAVSGAARSQAGTRAIALLRRALRSGPDDGGFWEVLGGSLLVTGSAEGLADGVDRLSTHPDPAVRAVAMSIRAQLLENRGRAEEALALLRQVDALAVRHGFEWLRIFGGMSAVSLLNQRGRYAMALETALALRTDAVALDAGMNLQQLDWLIATDRLALGELDAAEALFESLSTATARAASGDGADTHAIATAGLAEVATARGDAGVALPRWARALEDVRRSSWPWRVVVLAASLGGRARLGAPAEALVRDHRRLRGLLLAVARMDAERLDTPIFGAGLLGVSVLVRQQQPDLAERLRSFALALGARQDSAELHRLAQGPEPEPEPMEPETALEQALALLRSPATRR